MTTNQGQNRTKLAAAVGAGTAALLIAMVPVFEGKVLRTYRDPVGILTSCYGHTGPELRMGQRFTEQQCEEQLAADLLKHAAALKCVTVPLSYKQKASFISMSYNIGETAFCNSTLVKRVNNGELPYACAEISKWIYATKNGVKVELPGLVKRRKVEREVCES